MKTRRHWLALGLLGLAGTPVTASSLPTELRDNLPLAALSGQSKLTFWGFDVYDARLWITPGFKPSDYARHGFALELSYLRAFTNEEISTRSIDEMRRLPGGAQAPWKSWQAALRTAFPDVRKGDRIVGLHRPGEGATFFTNGKLTGAIEDPEFARLFFGIWIAPQSSQPRLREVLLSGAATP